MTGCLVCLSVFFLFVLFSSSLFVCLCVFVYLFHCNQNIDLVPYQVLHARWLGSVQFQTSAMVFQHQNLRLRALLLRRLPRQQVGLHCLACMYLSFSLSESPSDYLLSFYNLILPAGITLGLKNRVWWSVTRKGFASTNARIRFSSRLRLLFRSPKPGKSRRKTTTTKKVPTWLSQCWD